MRSGFFVHLTEAKSRHQREFYSQKTLLLRLLECFVCCSAFTIITCLRHYWTECWRSSIVSLVLWLMIQNSLRICWGLQGVFMILRFSSHWLHVCDMWFLSHVLLCFCVLLLSPLRSRNSSCTTFESKTNFPTGTIKFNVLHHQTLMSTQQLACQRVGKCLV